MPRREALARSRPPRPPRPLPDFLPTPLYTVPRSHWRGASHHLCIAPAPLQVHEQKGLRNRAQASLTPSWDAQRNPEGARPEPLSRAPRGRVPKPTGPGRAGTVMQGRKVTPREVGHLAHDGRWPWASPLPQGESEAGDLHRHGHPGGSGPQPVAPRCPASPRPSTRPTVPLCALSPESPSARSIPPLSSLLSSGWAPTPAPAILLALSPVQGHPGRPGTWGEHSSQARCCH